MTMDRSREGERLLALWSRGSRVLTLVHLDGSGDPIKSTTHILPDSISALTLSDLNGDGKPDLACVSSGDPAFFCVTSLTPETLKTTGTLPLAFRPTGITVTDDAKGGRNRILLYGRGSPGLTEVTGFRGANLRSGRIVASDLPVQFAEQTELNDDGISDLVVFDWIHNELHLLYGFGNGRYLDQTTFPVQGDVRDFHMIPPDLTGEAGFAVLTTNPDEVQLWQGDGLGDFKLQSTCVLKHSALSLSVADVNNDGWPDIVLMEEGGRLAVVFNSGEKLLDDVIEYAAGEDSKEVMTVEGPDGTGRAVVLDAKQRELLLFHNAVETASLTDSLTFSSGLGPTSLWIGHLADVNQLNIAVACSKSRSLNFYTNSPGGLVGPASISLELSPFSIGFHSRTDSVANFIVTSPEEQTIAFLTYNAGNQSHVTASIPGVGTLEPLEPGLADSSIQYYCFGAPGEAETPSLCFFQQLSGSHFIERSFRLTIPDALMGAAVDDINGDGRMDAAYVYKNDLTHRYELVVMEGDSSGEFTRRVSTTELPDTVIQKSYLYFADLNQDSIPDLLLCFPRAAQTARIAIGGGGGTYALAGKLDGPIRIAERDQLRIIDLDGDGILDIVANDFKRKAIGFWKGKGDGMFQPWKPLLRRNGISHFGFADFNGDGVKDLAVILSRQGVLKLIDGKQILKP